MYVLYCSLNDEILILYYYAQRPVKQKFGNIYPEMFTCYLYTYTITVWGFPHVHGLNEKCSQFLKTISLS